MSVEVIEKLPVATEQQLRTSAKSPRVKALIIAHDAKATGGVNNFLRIMRRCMRSRVDATRFSNGRRHGEKGKLSTLKRLVWDYVRFCILIRRRHFDILHVNPTLDLSSLPREMLFVWLCSIFSPRTKILLFYRGWDWKALEAIKASPVKRALFVATHKHIDRVLLLASSFRDALVELNIPASKIFTTSTMFEGAVLRQVLDGGAPKNPHQLLFMCRFLAVKGGREVLEALAEIQDRYPDVTLVMAGDGPDRQNLEALTQELGLTEKVTYTGYIGGVRKMTLLANSGIFLLPSSHPEGMPNAVLEAMAAGNIIVTTPVGGTADVVIHGENGSILERQNTGLVVEALLRHLGDPKGSAVIAERNTQKAWSSWESSIVSNSIADHYEAVVNGAAKG